MHPDNNHIIRITLLTLAPIVWVAHTMCANRFGCVVEITMYAPLISESDSTK